MIKKIAKKATKILAMLVVVVIILALGIIVAEPLLYNDFYSRDSQKDFETPGANDGLVQQGFCYAGNSASGSGSSRTGRSNVPVCTPCTTHRWS